MRRFYASAVTMPDMVLNGNEVRHISRVLRMRAGDMLVLFDGSGYDYTAEIVAVEENDVTLRVHKKEEAVNEPRVMVTIYQAVIKSDHFDYVVQKCTELGAYGFVPFISERCVKKPKSPQAFVEREARIALEAAKQCGRSRVPQIEGVMDLEQVAKRIENGFALIAYEGERECSLKQAVSGFQGDEIALIIGPEGGFADEEVKRLESAGAKPVSLGKLILRAETAGAAALAMIRYEFDK